MMAAAPTIQLPLSEAQWTQWVRDENCNTILDRKNIHKRNVNPPPLQLMEGDRNGPLVMDQPVQTVLILLLSADLTLGMSDYAPAWWMPRLGSDNYQSGDHTQPPRPWLGLDTGQCLIWLEMTAVGNVLFFSHFSSVGNYEKIFTRVQVPVKDCAYFIVHRSHCFNILV